MPVFAHLLVLGCIEVQGCSQPGDVCSSDGMTTALRLCTTALQDLLEKVMLLHVSDTQPSLEFCILRSRLMKVAFESTSISSMLTTNSISAVADMAAQSTNGVPTSVECILDKLHCIYPLGAYTTKAVPQVAQTDEKPSEAVPPTAAPDLSEFPAGPLTVVNAPEDNLLQKLQPTSLAGAATAGVESYVTTGSLIEAAAEAERALAIMLARLCVMDAIGCDLNKSLSAQQVAAVLRTLFVGGKDVVSPLFQAHPTLTIASIEKAVVNYTESHPTKLAALRRISLGLMNDEVATVLTHRDAKFRITFFSPPR